MTSLLRCLLGIVTVLPLLGCTPSARPGVTTTGTVTVDGQPLSGAVLTLEPINETTGPNASVPVLGGRFEIDASAGLHGGDYRARVSMIPAEIRASIPATAGYELPPPSAVIDPAFDGDSQLKCHLTPDDDNPLEFAVRFLAR
ncbi:hypothetical protein NHH03_20595 [Stieleria sp. TO1_6]|uniref:hypothetical protein n=1 Tax=Stieleria tagensis TaxID=2956795 RepID=UPI00209B4262|nr:hypothetical protein [Stieleria tagensis]MCO8124155.1 hypothetical protein [Stieleria tagensis]